MTKATDMTGKNFGRLKVLSRAESSNDKAYWLCLCSCGTKKAIQGKHLRSGAVVSCGCYSREMTSKAKKLNIAGLTFGRLTAVESLQETRGGSIVWKFKCSCGRETEALATSVKSGNTKSCGCLQPEIVTAANRTHGLTHTATYRTWANMLQRCTNPDNPNYKDYGARGIRVCSAWEASFEAFLADMGTRGEGMTLGRKDNEGNYEPTNCRWETREEQDFNKRNTAKVFYRGEIMTLREACGLSGIQYTAVICRKFRHKVTHQEAFDHYNK